MVETLAVTRMLDLVTEEPIAQVVFGQAKKITPQIRDRIPDENQAARGEIYSNTVVITVPISEANKYKVGSKWKISVDDKGWIAIRELK